MLAEQLRKTRLFNQLQHRHLSRGDTRFGSSNTAKDRKGMR